MGKNAKKKNRAVTIENTTMKVSEESSQEKEVKEKQACVHFVKNLNVEKVLDTIKSSRQIKCEVCKEGVHEKRVVSKEKNGFPCSVTKANKKAIWVCLECGCCFCGDVGLPTGAQSHILSHNRVTRHRLVIQWENPQLRWCFPCQTLLPLEIEENGEKKDVLSEVVKSIKGKELNGLASSDIEEQSSGSGSIKIKLETAVTIEAKDGYVVRGLVNLGNTCFFNSIMQNLFTLDQLRNHFLKENTSSIIGPLACSVKKLFSETKPDIGFKSAINPRVFFGSFCTMAPQFKGYDQHDSHELLRCLLDTLSTEESALRKKHDDEKSTLIDSVFGGETLSIVSCLECGHSSEVYETFLDLSLPVPFKKSPPKEKPQAFPLTKKNKLPPKRFTTKVSKALTVTTDSDASCSTVLDTFPVKQTSECDTVSDNFWLDVIGGDEMSLDVQDEADQIVYGPHLPADISASSNDQTLECNTERLTQDNDEPAKEETILDEEVTQSVECTATSDLPASNSVSSYDQTLPGNTDTLTQENDELTKAETIWIDKDVEATQSVECTAKISIPAEISHASQVVYVPDLPVNTSVSSTDQTLEGNTEIVTQENDQLAKDETILTEKNVEDAQSVVDCTATTDFPASTLVSSIDQTLEGNTETLTQENDKLVKDVNLLNVKATESVECTATRGDHGLLGGSSSVNPWEDEEELPMVVGDSQVLYLPYTPMEGEASSSYVTNDYEPENNDFVDMGGLFDEPESTERPVFGPLKADEASSAVSFMTYSSESDPEEVDDSGPPVTIERCLDHFTKTEILSDDNAWHCDNCSTNLKLQQMKETESGVSRETDVLVVKQDQSEISTVEDGKSNGSESEAKDPEKLITVKRDATKRVVINKAPQVLTIHLKRFSQDLRGRLNKLNGHVAFKEIIDIGEYMNSRCTGEDLPVYRLVGLVEHSGTMRRGHYVAYVRGGQRGKETDVWYCVSDAWVREVSLKKVLQSEAYILFYQRIISQE